MWKDCNVQKSVETLSRYAVVSSIRGETFDFIDSFSQSLCRAMNETLNNEEECIEAALATIVLDPAQLANIKSLWGFAKRYPNLTVKYSFVASFICRRTVARGSYAEALSFAMQESLRHDVDYGENNLQYNLLIDVWSDILNIPRNIDNHSDEDYEDLPDLATFL